jgi:hypothetical protein
MKIDREKIILVTTKYLSYLINIAIVGGLLGGAGTWVYLLYLSAK